MGGHAYAIATDSEENSDIVEHGAAIADQVDLSTVRGTALVKGHTLVIYLNDHNASAVAAVDLARRGGLPNSACGRARWRHGH